MELLYLYIQNEKTYEMNFSPEIRFKMDTSEIPATLRLVSNSPNSSIFRDKNIQNATAIVGKNGTGKTYLINQIFDIFKRINTTGYKNDIIVIYYDEDNQLSMYKGLAGINTDFKDLSIEKVDSIFLTNTSALLLSNSAYANMQTDYDKNSENLLPFHSFECSTKSIELIKHMFYDSLFDQHPSSYCGSESYVEDSTDRYYSGMCDYCKNIIDLSYITTVLYFSKIFKKDKKAIKSDEKLDSTMHFIKSNIFKRISLNIIDCNSMDENHELNSILEHYNGLKDILDISAGSAHRNYIVNQILSLMNNLVIEHINNPRIEIIDQLINDYIDFRQWNNEDWKKTIAFLKEHDYLGCKELKKLLSILRKFDTSSQNTYEYNNPLRFDYNKNPEQYKSFILFFKELVDKQSILLRYFDIQLEGYSSGERAFLNLVSWINFAPYINNLCFNNDSGLKNNLLILIDELDLYMHPEWQVKIIHKLLDELKEQFSEHKVQLIISTHSPLVLSDIPKDNIIFLNEDGTDTNENHDETFGRDVYSILNDSFYLKHTMGEFAHDFIKEQIIEPLNDPSYTDFEILQERINLIGNQILRSKLKNMLYRRYDTAHRIQDLDNQIRQLEAQKALLKEQLGGN